MNYNNKTYRYAVKGLSYQTLNSNDTPAGYPEIFKKNGELRKGWVLTNNL